LKSCDQLLDIRTVSGHLAPMDEEYVPPFVQQNIASHLVNIFARRGLANGGSREECGHVMEKHHGSKCVKTRTILETKVAVQISVSAVIQKQREGQLQVMDELLADLQVRKPNDDHRGFVGLELVALRGKLSQVRVSRGSASVPDEHQQHVFGGEEVTQPNRTRRASVDELRVTHHCRHQNCEKK